MTGEYDDKQILVTREKDRLPSDTVHWETMRSDRDRSYSIEIRLANDKKHSVFVQLRLLGQS